MVKGVYLGAVYLALMNALAFITSAFDKYSAKHSGMRRIPEKTLFTLAFLGGSAGLYLSMRMLRHKTKHRKFVIGVPIILIAQILLIVFLLLWRFGLISI